MNKTISKVVVFASLLISSMQLNAMTMDPVVATGAVVGTGEVLDGSMEAFCENTEDMIQASMAQALRACHDETRTVECAYYKDLVKKQQELAKAWGCME